MPQQEMFFEQIAGDRRVEVLKTYDPRFAREAFGDMDEAARNHLWSALGIDKTYDGADIPPSNDPAREEFLWDELLEAAREDGNVFSFFVVTEGLGNKYASLYVSPDWPSAEAFARHRFTAA